MSTWTIPTVAGVEAFDQQVELDGRVYDLRFRWNARDGHWFMDVGRDGQTVLYGIKLVHVDDFLSQVRRVEELPPGRLYVVDLDGLDRDPDDENFGDRVLLRYDDA